MHSDLADQDFLHIVQSSKCTQGNSLDFVEGISPLTWQPSEAQAFNVLWDCWSHMLSVDPSHQGHISWGANGCWSVWGQLSELHWKSQLSGFVFYLFTSPSSARVFVEKETLQQVHHHVDCALAGNMKWVQVHWRLKVKRLHEWIPRETDRNVLKCQLLNPRCLFPKGCATCTVVLEFILLSNHMIV